VSPDYKVRQAGLHDLDSLMLLEEMVFHAAEYHLIGRRQYRYFLQEANAEIWVVEIDGQVRASAILFYQKNRSHCRLYSIAVHPDFQGKGIGSQIFRELEAMLLVRGYRELRQEVRSDRSELIALYLKRGYQIYAKTENYYPDGVSCVRLKKVLKGE
jgi:ribosomal protein S18 acetylase RimI-like enzyme